MPEHVVCLDITAFLLFGFMKLYELIQAYDFDEIMPVISNMFPGTSKYRKPLQQAYDILLEMRPVSSKKTIRYKLMRDDNSGDSYMGAADADFRCTWEVCLGKEVSRERGVDLNDAEILANCLVNICFLATHPRLFDGAYAELTRPER